jgi:hypothetical protein
MLFGRARDLLLIYGKVYGKVYAKFMNYRNKIGGKIGRGKIGGVK